MDDPRSPQYINPDPRTNAYELTREQQREHDEDTFANIMENDGND